MWSYEKEYASFLQYDKTWIILNGGTTRDNEHIGTIGTMNEIRVFLLKNYIPHSAFNEPDLNYALTALCFLADERVWNKEKYPDYREDLVDIILSGYSEEKIINKEKYNQWCDLIGGSKNVFLRELIKDKRLA